MITCYTVSEIWRMTDVIVIFHFKLFFALLLPPLHPPHPHPLTAQKIKKMKKMSGDMIILHVCTKNSDQMMYGF